MGKEINEEFGLGWLDYGARFYDPAIGRFTSIDPLAETYSAWSPYHYTYNNPILYTDPDGRSIIKGLKAAYNVGKRAYKTYKKTGKVNVKSIGKALKDEALDIIDTGATLFDGNASLGEKAFAVFDLATGFGDEAKAAGKALGIGDDVADATKNRVKLRKGTKEQIKENAPKTADGDFIDPNTGQIIPKDGPYDISHKTGQEWKTRKKMHQERGSTRKEVIEAENNPDLYQIEDPSSNRSHKYEKKGN